MRRTGNSGALDCATIDVYSGRVQHSSCGTSGSWVLWVGGLLGEPTGYSMDVRASSGASKELADDTVYAQVCGMRYAVCSG